MAYPQRYHSQRPTSSVCKTLVESSSMQLLSRKSHTDSVCLCRSLPHRACANAARHSPIATSDPGSSAMLRSSASSRASSHSSLRALVPLCPPRSLSLSTLLLSRPPRPARWTVSAVQKSPKGFGNPTEKEKKSKKESKLSDGSSLRRVEKKQQEEEDPEDDVVPEVVTNRMLKRITFTVGIPFAVGVAFFVLFYYLKAVKKVDIPEWLPLFTSLLTFGSAGAGITYGVLSASWDPKRAGSLLGWKEAQLNWPVFWETFRGKRDGGKSR